MSKISLMSITFNATDKFSEGDILSIFDAKVFNFLWRRNVLKQSKIYLELYPSATRNDLESQLKSIPLVFSVLDTELEDEINNLDEANALFLTEDELKEKAKNQITARHFVVNSILSKLSQV